MTTKETIHNYFRELKKRNSWESFLADDFVFTSFVVPIKRVTGKAAYLDSTKRFFSMISSVEVKDIIIEGERACVLTCYELQSPQGDSFTSDVAEIFNVRDGKIYSLAIYFDSSPFPK
jgi:ketosteroid isomerase-like protein